MMIESILISTFVTSALATLFALLGRIWVNRARERDREQVESALKELSHQIELSLHTNKSIFEKEFESAVSTWNSVLKLVVEVLYIRRDALSGIIPIDQIKKCYEQHIETHDILYMYAPFYPVVIRDAAFDTGAVAQIVYQEAEKVLGDPNAISLIETLCSHQLSIVQSKVEKFKSEIRERYVFQESLAQRASSNVNVC